jgi:DNA-directed RNA polymerase subunit alpha
LSALAIPKIENLESKDSYGRFLAEPMAKGFGTTLANALRRVLLSYLPGTAVTHVRIEGIQHEFSPIPYAKEDVLEFLLNIKELKSLSGQAGKLTLEKEGSGEVYAADIKPSTDFEIANPELYLATLDSPDARLYVELDAELGTGYRPAEAGDNLPAGTIPVDAIFTPVRKVNFAIEPVHVGHEASQERLYLEVWTDGTISPSDALSNSADILMEQLKPFVDYGQVSKIDEEKKALRKTISEELYNMPIEQLDLSVRAMNCLRRSGINTVGELISIGEKELMSLRNFGQKSRQEIAERLKSLGLSLSTGVAEPETPPAKKSRKKKPVEKPDSE